MAHARHDADARGDIRTISGFHADFADWGIHGAHDVRHDVHGAATHAAVKQRADFVFRGTRIHPVVGRPGVGVVPRADEGQVLSARDVVYGTAVEMTVWKSFLVQRDTVPGAH